MTEIEVRTVVPVPIVKNTPESRSVPEKTHEWEDYEQENSHKTRARIKMKNERKYKKENYRKEHRSKSTGDVFENTNGIIIYISESVEEEPLYDETIPVKVPSKKELRNSRKEKFLCKEKAEEKENDIGDPEISDVVVVPREVSKEDQGIFTDIYNYVSYFTGFLATNKNTV